ncbi:Phage terminase, large subunit [Rhodovulum sp. PH10]|uniref:phage terminase large subunit family protein n=1 Tax=Rhodovulum sp. PH10 TaxID=1187851 RepID=UPI00027C29E6|nr:terminase gpA endonuclease subunit [Rhodovulum sp. PH10]EJW12619.1 Phage terminase, large subunit [Rhodovulum sp. PH10]
MTTLAAELRSRFRSMPNGRHVVAAALARAARPEQELTVSEWADCFRVVSAESGSRFPGPWLTSRVPLAREIMDCLHPDHPARLVVNMGSAQIVKTEVIVNWFGYIVDRAPGPMLVVLPSLDEAVKFNRVKLQPTIDASPQIRHRVKPENSRDEAASTTSFKRFAGGFAQIVTASSSKGLQGISIRYLAMDEISEYPIDVDGRGSPIAQAQARQKSWGDLAKTYVSSTPGLLGDCRITELYEAGDQRRAYLPCPECGSFAPLDYERMQPPSESTNQRVTFACPDCGSLIDQVHRADMLARGRWIATRVAERDPPVPGVIKPADLAQWECAPCEGRCRDWHPSYSWWSGYSNFESWSDIWSRGEDARGNPIKLKVFSQQDLGRPYDPSADAPDWQKLLEARAEWLRGTVPWPACLLTGFIDVQGDRLEWGIWAWGAECQGWLIDCGVIPHPAETDEAWQEVDALLAASWPTANGVTLPVSAWGIDTGYVSPLIYQRALGRHNLRVCRGAAGVRARDALPCNVKNVPLNNHLGTKLRARAVRLHFIGTFALKSTVYQGLRQLAAGPDADGRFGRGTLHLPGWIGEDYAKQLTAEILYDPKAQAKGKARRALLERPGDQREWRKMPGRANEALDIAVGSRALAWLMKVDGWTPAQWAERAADAWGSEPPAEDLFSAPAPAAPTRPSKPLVPLAPTPVRGRRVLSRGIGDRYD